MDTEQMSDYTHIAFTTISGYRILWPIAALGLTMDEEHKTCRAVSITEDIHWSLSKTEYDRLLKILSAP